MLQLMKDMNDKMGSFDARFNGMESLLKEENEKLRSQLDMVQKKYEAVCSKVVVLSKEVNRLRQDNISRNVLVKGVPELETDTTHLKTMVRSIFAKLRYNLDLSLMDCFRIGRKSDTTCRPIVVGLPSVGLKNEILRDKRIVKLTCANFMNDGTFWGSADQIIYLDEHLTRENHLLYMATRKLKHSGFKFVWTRNGHIFVRFNENASIVKIESVHQIKELIARKMALDKKAQQDNQKDESEVMSTGNETDGDGDGFDDDLDKYEGLINNPPSGRNKRKNSTPPNHNHDKTKHKKCP